MLDGEWGGGGGAGEDGQITIHISSYIYYQHIKSVQRSQLCAVFICHNVWIICNKIRQLAQ